MVYDVPRAQGGAMSTTPPDTQQPQGPGPDSGPRVGWDDIRDLGRIRRVTADRRVAGVAGGLARHLDIDPLIVRVGFVVLTFFGGVGLLLYIACWLLIPEDGSDWARVALDRRSRTVALVLVGILALVILVSHGWWGGGYPWALLIVAGLVALLATQWPRHGRSGDVPASGPTPGAVPPLGGTVPPSSPYTPPAPTYVQPVQPRPVNPRKRGPVLFWFALAVMAVALGALGVVDLAGASFAPSAYPALVLALTGVFLLVGAFFGRAGGLILVGLLAWGVTTGVTIADRWDVHRTVERPATSLDVHNAYRIDAGELVVDLSQVSDPSALDGRVVHVDGDVGHLDIRVPAGVNVIAHLDIDGPGGISAFGQDVGGLGRTLNTRLDASRKAPTLTIDADLDIGAIDLHTEGPR
jgi:phage shock protein PspC (stress-responsive transcriptional regulator)